MLLQVIVNKDKNKNMIMSEHLQLVVILHSRSYFTKIPHPALFIITFQNPVFCFQVEKDQLLQTPKINV